MLTTDRWILYRALRVATAVTLLCIYVNITHLPIGRWAVLTTVIVSNMYYGASLKKSWDRLLGTFFGCAAAYLLGVLVIQDHYNFVYTIPIFIFLTWYAIIFSYAWAMFFSMIMLVCILYMSALPPGTDVAQYMLARIIDIALGITVACLSEILFPIKKHHDLILEKFQQIKALQQTLVEKCTDLLEQGALPESLLPDLKTLQELQSQVLPLMNVLNFEFGHYSADKTELLKKDFADFQELTIQLNNFYLSLCNPYLKPDPAPLHSHLEKF